MTSTEVVSRRRSALITGASGGIGEAFADLLSDIGFDLFLVARRETELETIATRARSKGVQAFVLAIDLTTRTSAESVKAWTVSQGISIDLLVNNAGFGLLSEVGDVALADELGMIDLNVRSLTELTHLFLPDLIAQRGGIINVSSLNAFQPMPYLTIYSATKAYILSYSRMLSTELKPKGVRCLAVCPGYTATGFQARAGADVSSLDRFVPKHSPAKVARDAWRAFEKGRHVHIVGVGNWVMARLGFIFSPLSQVVAKQVYRLAQKQK